MKRTLLVLLAGMLFGAGLAISGMTDPARVIGFLDVAGNWDATLAFVMGGALLVFGSGYALLRRCGIFSPNEGGSISGRLIIGAAVFGVGWGMSGFCPGPAIANFGRISMEALVFVPAMAAGMILAQRAFGADREPPAEPARREDGGA